MNKLSEGKKFKGEASVLSYPFVLWFKMNFIQGRAQIERVHV